MEVQNSNTSLLHAPWVHVLRPLPEAAMKRAGSRRLGLPQQLLQICPPSGRRNMSSCLHQALKNAQGNLLFVGWMIWHLLGSMVSTGVGGRGASAMVDVEEVGEVRSKREG